MALELAFLLKAMQEQRKTKFREVFANEPCPELKDFCWLDDDPEAIADEVTVTRDKYQWMDVVGDHALVDFRHGRG